MSLGRVSTTLQRAVHDADWRKQFRFRGRSWRAFSRLGLTGLHAAPVHRTWLDIRRLRMPLPDLPARAEGLRLVQISDLHVSPVVTMGFLREQLRHVAELRPDLLVVTGDLITGGHRYAKLAARLLAELDPQPPMGIVCTLGNHDYGLVGKRNPREGEARALRLQRELGRFGIRLLRNEAVEIAGVTIVGLDDLYTDRLDADVAFDGVDGPTICLNHDPRNAVALKPYPWHWMLAGHTHGRQLGRKLGGRARRPFVRGLYDLGDGQSLYVNRGLSYGQRWQNWCKPEITVFKLTAA
ncbi:MAG: metallophosphoesterase [Planctomycetota bacterium]